MADAPVKFNNLQIRSNDTTAPDKEINENYFFRLLYLCSKAISIRNNSVLISHIIINSAIKK